MKIQRQVKYLAVVFGIFSNLMKIYFSIRESGCLPRRMQMRFDSLLDSFENGGRVGDDDTRRD